MSCVIFVFHILAKPSVASYTDKCSYNGSCGLFDVSLVTS